MSREIERALGHGDPGQEGNEGRERRGEEQPAPLTAGLNDEDPPEGDREEESDRPEEVEEHHVPAARLRGQELREQGRVHHEHAPEAEAREQPETEDAPRVPRDRGQRREHGVPKDAREEDRATTAIVGEAPEEEAADERAD